MKINLDINVYDAAKKRMRETLNHFEKWYLSFSGGKDSSTMFHLAMEVLEEFPDRKIGILIIDLEAQYKHTIDHMQEMVETYRDRIDLYWVCLPLSLRNAVSNFEPRWCCWEPGIEWVRPFPEIHGVIKEVNFFDFFYEKMEFEEFMVEFGKWYSGGISTGAMIGIRSDESLNRYRTIASSKKEMIDGKKWTTKVCEHLYNIYPIYDWKTEDIWKYHSKTGKKYNLIYDYMYRAGLPLSKMRLCQPYGDDQRRGLNLFHVLEPKTWVKIVNRVNGANSGALYIQENGNINGYNKITLPAGHNWETYSKLIFSTMPKITQDHYIKRFRVFIKWWKKRGYPDGIGVEAPIVLENKGLAPSWRRIAKVLLRNDYWCKGLKFSQPKSEAWKKFVSDRKKNNPVSGPSSKKVR